MKLTRSPVPQMFPRCAWLALVGASFTYLLIVPAIGGSLGSDPPVITGWYSPVEHQRGVGGTLLEIPDDGAFSEPRCADITTLLVQFNEPIDPDTFTGEGVKEGASGGERNAGRRVEQCAVLTVSVNGGADKRVERPDSGADVNVHLTGGAGTRADVRSRGLDPDVRAQVHEQVARGRCDWIGRRWKLLHGAASHAASDNDERSWRPCGVLAAIPSVATDKDQQPEGPSDSRGSPSGCFQESRAPRVTTG